MSVPTHSAGHAASSASTQESTLARLGRHAVRAPIIGPIVRWVGAVARLPKKFDHIQNCIDDIHNHLAPLNGVLADLASLKHENHQRLLGIQGTESRVKTLEEGAERTEILLSRNAGEAPASHDRLYYDFEESFRGSREAVLQKLRTYLPYTEGLSRTGAKVLDIGCGRGEWLRLLKDAGIAARGIDLNSIMVKECAAAGLDVVHADGLSALKELEDGSLGAVTGFHIVEHLDFATLIALLREANRVVMPGGFVAFETPNPENMLVATCDFYTDMTHRNPIPPAALGFLLGQAGFHRQECLRLGGKNPPVTGNEEIDELARRMCVGRDYAIVGWKST